MIVEGHCPHCWFCGAASHLAKMCPKKNPNNNTSRSSFNQTSNTQRSSGEGKVWSDLQQLQQMGRSHTEEREKVGCLFSPAGCSIKRSSVRRSPSSNKVSGWQCIKKKEPPPAQQPKEEVKKQQQKPTPEKWCTQQSELQQQTQLPEQQQEQGQNCLNWTY